MLTVLLIVLLILCLGGWGYGRVRPWPGADPAGLVGLVLLVVLILLLARVL